MGGTLSHYTTLGNGHSGLIAEPRCVFDDQRNSRINNKVRPYVAVIYEMVKQERAVSIIARTFYRVVAFGLFVVLQLCCS